MSLEKAEEFLKVAQRCIEFLGDGSVEVERFLSNGEICGEEALHELLRKYGNPNYAEAI